MINAKFYETSDDELVGFSVSGHAGYDDFGNDIVCASVSSAVMLAANTITEAFKAEAKVKVTDNRIEMRLKKHEQNAEKVLLGLLTHLYMLSEDYQGTIKVSIEKA